MNLWARGIAVRLCELINCFSTLKAPGLHSLQQESKFWKNQCLNLVVNLDRKDIKVSFCSRTFLLKLLIKLNNMMRDACAQWPWEWCTLETYDCNASAIQWWNFSHANEMVNMTWCNCHDADSLFCIHYGATMLMLLTDACMRCISMMHIWISWWCTPCNAHTVPIFPRLKFVSPIHLSKDQKLWH